MMMSEDQFQYTDNGVDSEKVFERSVRKAYNRASDALNNYDARPILSGIRIGQARYQLSIASNESPPTDVVEGDLFLQFAIDHLDDAISSFEDHDLFLAGVKVEKARGTLQEILNDIRGADGEDDNVDG